ncbi:MAG TPA: hypothetical protein VLM37_04910, partial [Fibrobacteraceae bacterium]|nr:hypothetical protein [Fibrobacteraceae bacterium]
LDFYGNLVARRYQSSLSADGEDSRLEKNIGIYYTWNFWDFCLFGLGMCPEEDSLASRSVP